MNAIAGHVMMVVASLVPAAGTVSAQQPRPTGEVALRFWGHACFTVSAGGKTVLIDPYSAKVGYQPFDVSPDLVLISHEHFDHSDTSWLKGKPVVLHGLDAEGEVEPIDRTVGPFRVRTVAARHWQDPSQKQRGSIAILVIEVAGLKIVHCGDLGEPLDDRQVAAIGQPDVLLVPVGGFFTIDGEQAWQVVQQLKPRAYVVPMHYRTGALNESLRSRLAEPAPFLRRFGEHLMRLEGNELKVEPGSLPKELTAVLMGYVPAPVTQPGATQPARQQ